MVMRMKKEYTPTAFGLYLNFFVHGMSVVILSQNAANLAVQWHTTVAGALAVVSSLGLGRLFTILISGILSDKIGRKPFVIIGILAYLSFFIGLLLSPNVTIAYVAGILAGAGNSFLDAATYPALMEIYPEAKGSSNVIIKAFISAGTFLLPLIASFLTNNHLWFGWSFILPIAILTGTLIFFLTMSRFPARNQVKTEEVTVGDAGNKLLDGGLFLLYGFISQGTFYLISQMLTQYGLEVGHLSETTAHALVSWYSVGSITCVFVTALLGRKFREIQFVPVYTFGALVSIALMWLFPTNAPLMTILAVCVGYFAAGGVMQLALTVMAEFFPQGKGTVTGIFYTSGSLASFVLPLAIKWIGDMHQVMLLDLVIALAGFIVTSLIAIRYKKLFGSLKKAE